MEIEGKAAEQIAKYLRLEISSGLCFLWFNSNSNSRFAIRTRRQAVARCSICLERLARQKRTGPPCLGVNKSRPPAGPSLRPIA